MGLVFPVKQFIRKHDFIQVEANKFTSKKSLRKVKLPQKPTVELCRLIGIIHGDGNLFNNRVLIADKSKEFHEVLRKLFKKIFRIEPNLFFDKNRNSYYSHFKNKVIFRFMKEILETPERKEKLKPPPFLNNLSLKCEYVGGVFDAEAHVRKRQAEIDFSISSRSIFEMVKAVFTRVGIKYSIYIRHRRKKPEYEIRIYGKDDLKIFHQKIKFIHPDKIRRISKFVSAC